MQIKKSRRNLPKYLQISEMLIRDIASGQLPDGSRLPTERDMARGLRISVGTLRKALTDLTSRGMLQRVQGSGNYIRSGSAVDSVYAFFRVELIKGGGVPTARLIEVTRLPKPAGAPRFGKATEGYRIRRLRYLNNQAAVLEEIWLDGNQTDQLHQEDLLDALYLFYRHQLNLWITRAEDRLGVEPLPDWAPAAFGVARGTPCLCAHRLAFDQHDTPVEYSCNWIDTSLARYTAQII